MFPDAAKDPTVRQVMIVLSIVGIIYGALVAMAQKDVKKLVAYSSVSHLGFVMLGLFAFNPNGINGAVMQMINHGISTGALFMLAGILYERRHIRGEGGVGCICGGRNHTWRGLYAVALSARVFWSAEQG
jgi:NADH-quinone oxidoreductase subunit M